MKRIAVAVSVALLVVGIVFAAQRNGVGSIVEAVYAGESINIYGARKVSIVNLAASANNVWVQVDGTVATLQANIILTNAIPIPPGGSWTFAEDPTMQTYQTVQIACATGETATAYMASN